MTERDPVFYDLLQKISDKTDDISNNIKNLEGNLGSLDKKVDLHIQKTEYELKNIHETDTEQNKILDKHIEGVNTLRDIHEVRRKEVDKRLEELEAPKKWFSITKKLILALGALAAAGLGIARLLEMF